MASHCVNIYGLGSWPRLRFWCALFRKVVPKLKNMAERSWVEQLKQFNARHSKDKAGKLS